MSDKLNLKCDLRTERAKDLRKQSIIPAVLYGKKQASTSIQLDYHDFRRTFEKSGYNTIIELEVAEGKKIPVLVHEVVLDPIKDTFTHIDFFAVQMDQKITAMVPLNYVGVSPAIKDLGGILIHNKNEIEVECLPKDLIHNIDLDISTLVDFHSSIKVNAIKEIKKIKILDNPETLLLTVSAPRKAVEENEENVTPEVEETTTEDKKAE